MNHKQLILFLFLGGVCSTSAQNTTNSPVSMFGIGDITTGESGKYAGMGGVSIAMRSGNYLNMINPAGLTGVDSCRLVYEVGGKAAVKSYIQSGAKNTSVVGNVTNLALGCRVLPHWYMALGVTPVSSVGYAVTMEQNVEGTDGSSLSSYFEGTGGLYRVNLGQAIKLGRFSLGANLSAILGDITYSETQSGASITEESSMRAFYADFGMQYTIPIRKYTNLCFGLVCGYHQKLYQDNEMTVSNTSSSSEIVEDVKFGKKYLPQYIGFGTTLGSRRWTVSAEYKYLQWDKMESDYSTISYRNQHRASIGLEWLTGDIWRNPWHWMIGANVGNSYVVIKHHNTINYSVTAGFGVPVMQGSTFSAGLRYDGQKAHSSLQRESSFSFYINLSFSEITNRSKIR